MTITLHHLENSRSQRVLWLLEELGLPVKGIAAKVGDGFVMPNIKRQLAYIESELGRHAWFAGDEFSAADIQMSYPLEAAAARAGLGTEYPNITAWLAAIHARPAYRKALEAGGPYAVVL